MQQKNYNIMEKEQATFYPVDMPDEERVQRNKHLIDVIIKLLEAQKEFGNNPIEYNKLLNLAVREYILPEDHWHISESAIKMWDLITKDDIRKFTYQQRININKLEGSIEVGESIIIEGESKVPFNKIFISEHITPVSDVIKVLENQPFPLTPEKVAEILDKMHIARILQSENEKIQKRNNRWTDFSDVPDYKEIVKTFYNSEQIFLVEFKSILL